MNQKMSRLGIFVFYDPQGVVDGYVIHLLQALRPNVSRLVTISNCPLDDTARNILEKHSDALFIRENRGLDAAAFKEGLVSFCGWEEAETYDEVVLVNDTFFGPIHSFDEMFADMSNRDVDFWGMSAGYLSVDGWNKVKYGYTPDHIQTFFVAFRKNMVRSKAFHEYWNNYDDTMNDFVSVVTQHEMVMTRHFQDLGFRWDIYSDTKKYRSDYKTENFNIYFHQPHQMMRNMKFPALKKKVLNVEMPDYLYMNDLENSADAMAYIQNETDYDSNLIWDNVLRLYNVTDLYHSLHLNYVLPSVPAELSDTVHAALVFQIADPFFAERICEQARKLAESFDVYLLPENENAAKIAEAQLHGNKKITVLEPSGQITEMGSFVLRCKELAQRYPYLGFVHDVQNPEHYPTTVPESAVYGYLQNIANDANYASQIINCFENNPRLGVLGAPFPIHHNGFSNYGNEWGKWFPATKALAEELDLHCKLSSTTPPLMITGTFWCRTAALRSLWNINWSVNQFQSSASPQGCQTNEALKRILPYVAQHEGYYSGIVMHTNYASMRITAQQYMLDNIISVTRQQQFCIADSYIGYIQQLRAIYSNGQNASLTVNFSQLGLRSVLLICLKRYTPKWFSDAILKVYRRIKKFFLPK